MPLGKMYFENFIFKRNEDITSNSYIERIAELTTKLERKKLRRTISAQLEVMLAESLDIAQSGMLNYCKNFANK